MSKIEKWFDCNGVELHEGDKVRDTGTGKEERVYVCHPYGQFDDLSLGVNASNDKFLENHPDMPREIYPFIAFPFTVVDGKRVLKDFEKVVPSHANS